MDVYALYHFSVPCVDPLLLIPLFAVIYLQPTVVVHCAGKQKQKRVITTIKSMMLLEEISCCYGESSYMYDGVIVKVYGFALL